MYEKTYREVSLLATEYFRALMTIKAHEGTRIHEGCEIVQEDPEGNTAGNTYSITVKTGETYNLMQKVLEAENG